jgi:hypothetical protein
MCADLASNRPGESIRKLLEQRASMNGERGLPVGRWPDPFEDRALRKGLDGEEKVARRLSLLGEGWWSLHSIAVNTSGTDVDHLLIGPAGVFTVNTKNHLGQDVWVAQDIFMVNGFRQDYIYCSRSERAKVATTLSRECGFDVPVEAMIVVLAEHFCVKEEPRDVHVVDLETLRFWLKRRPVTLTPSEVTTIYEAARESTNWLKAQAMVGAEGAK